MQTSSPSQTNAGMILKSEIQTELASSDLSQDVQTAITNWLAEQPGEVVPQEAVMLQLSELAEIENHMADTMGELAGEMQSLVDDSRRLEEQNQIAELQIQKDGLAEIEQHVQMAEQLVPDTVAPVTITSQTPPQAPVAATSPNVAA